MSNADLITKARELASKMYEEGSDASVSQFLFQISSALEACDNRNADLADQLAHCQTSRQKAREEVLRVLDKRLAGKDQGK